MPAARNSTARLTVAAVLVGVLALGLVALGWWLRDWEFSTDRGRYLDPSWWAGVIVIGLGNLAFGKVGFKIALAVVAGGAALLWARRRRADHPAGDSSTDECADAGRSAQRR
ncbi:hypothetical protein [Micromonospora echinospora]|uniref:hypothetical protein n=1 Tax=Micromonospora echinospora TaxID=1877 RepID=UPI003A8A0AAA